MQSLLSKTTMILRTPMARLTLNVGYELLKAVKEASDVFPPLKSAASAAVHLIDQIKASNSFRVPSVKHNTCSIPGIRGEQERVVGIRRICCEEGGMDYACPF